MANRAQNSLRSGESRTARLLYRAGGLEPVRHVVALASDGSLRGWVIVSEAWIDAVWEGVNANRGTSMKSTSVSRNFLRLVAEIVVDMAIT